MATDMHHRIQHNGTAGRDRGIAVVFFAISVTAILTIGALVLGGSIGYTAVRNAQTAADAAALAGTTTLRDHKQNWVETRASKILDEVESVVESNGATLAPGGCELVRATYALTRSDADVIDECDQLESLAPEDFDAAAGVRVTVDDTRSVPFAAFVDSDTITGRAVAVATIQPVVSGRSPFMVCADPEADGHPAPALLPDEDDPTGFSVNEAAVGKYFVLWGNQIKYGGRDCGNPASDWRGLVEFEATFDLPSPSPVDDTDWWQTESGNKNGNLPRTMAGSKACKLDGEKIDQLEIGCRIAIPLCPAGNGDTSDFRLYCAKLGTFEISHKGSVFNDVVTGTEYATPCGIVTENIICGEFVGVGTATSGQGSAEQPDANSVVLIKLVE